MKKMGKLGQIKGMYSKKGNPLQGDKAKMTSVRVGPGMNPDQKKVQSMLQKEHMGRESIRGKGY